MEAAMTQSNKRTLHQEQLMTVPTRILLFCTALLLLASVLPTFIVRAQGSGDALAAVDPILRYMKSANYSEEDLLRRIVWSDKLVNDMVAHRPSDDDRQNYLKLLDMGTNHYQDENTRLKIILRAITTLDPLVSKYFPQWIVQDEAMILEIMRKVRDNRDDLRDAEAIEVADRLLSGKARMRIVQSPRDPDNLIGILIEKARSKNPNNPESAGFSTNLDNGDYEDYRIVGRKNLRDVLTADLYDRVVARTEYSHLMETGVMKPAPYVAEANLGIPFGGGFLWTLESDERKDLGVAVQVSRIRAGFELKLGNEWVNLPFLYGPEWNALFVYEPSRTEHIKIGPAVPFTWGDNSLNSSFPVLKPRKTNGTWGVSGEYFKQLSNISGSPGTDADGIGAAAFVSAGLNTLGNKKITNVNGVIINGDGVDDRYHDKGIAPKNLSEVTFYYINSTATAYYWRDLGFMLSGLRIAAGFGYQKVTEARRAFNGVDGLLTSVDSVKVLGTNSTFDLYAKLSYDHRGKTTYGAALQYFNGSLMAEAYLNIFAWMRAEIKYSRIVFRDPEIFELQEMIVPGVRLAFAF
jgi:hypothetical protein